MKLKPEAQILLLLKSFGPMTSGQLWMMTEQSLFAPSAMVVALRCLEKNGLVKRTIEPSTPEKPFTKHTYAIVGTVTAERLGGVL